MTGVLPFVLALLVAQTPPPKILLDQSPRAVEYQIGRLTNDELARVERHPDDPRYRPIYAALLTRKGLSRQLRDEAVAALTTYDKTSPTQVLIDGLGKLPGDDDQTAGKLLAMLLGQPAETLRAQRDLFQKALDAPSPPFVLEGAYGALTIADGAAAPTWQAAAAREGRLVLLLRAVPAIPSGDNTRTLRDQLAAAIAARLTTTGDPVERVAALSALASARPDTATFAILSREITASPAGADASTKAAAVAGLLAIPPTARPPAADIEPLARAVTALVRDTPARRRTEPGILQAVQLGEELASALPDPSRVDVRRELRALSVRVIRLETRPEQMLFDLNWFVVEAGKPVQVSLTNPDAMPHNLVIARPGTLNEVATAAISMQMPTDPNTKAFVPDLPAVLQATKLLSEGDIGLLNFTAPAQPGEYVYLCTFPGHWVRMYGVMLVVDNLEAWEAHPTTPTDPITKQPYASQRK